MENFCKLSRRMQMNAALVTPGYRLADVGCDHAYLPIALIGGGRIPSAIALDVNRGPLQAAAEHIREAHMEDYIEVRLSDGVRGLACGEADAVLIAGMGGALTERIIEEGAETLMSVRELILQPQSEIGRVRRFLWEAGWRIVREDMLCEDGKYYAAMKAVHREATGEEAPYTEAEYRYGRKLLESRSPVLKEWLLTRRKAVRKIVEELERAGGGKRSARRLGEMRRELALIGEALERLTDGKGEWINDTETV